MELEFLAFMLFGFKPFLALLNLMTSSDIHGFLLLLLCSRMLDAADRMDLLNATKVMLISSKFWVMLVSSFGHSPDIFGLLLGY